MRREYNRRKSYTRSNNRKNYNNAYYNSTSVAYDYVGERIYYEPRRKNNIEKKKKLKRNKIRVVNEKTVHSFRVYFTAFAVFAFAIFIIGTNAFVTEQKSQISQLKEELKQIEEDNTYIQTELTKNIDLKEVEKQASVKLGMQKPAQYQIVYIDVPEQSYTVKHETAVNETVNGENSGLMGAVKNFLRID